MFPLETKIGIIGGGQLGKMMALDAKRLGFYIVVLDPDPNCPAASVCDKVIAAPFSSDAAYFSLAEDCGVITYEFEHINAAALERLENAGKKVYPTAKSLLIIQDKFTQKQALAAAGIPVPDFEKVDNVKDLTNAARKFGFPFVLKTRKDGYDGKGNFVIREDGDIAAFSGKIENMMAERFADFAYETSALVCRGVGGEVVVYPSGLNLHKNGVLDKTTVPAPISPETEKAARDIAERVMRVFGGVGMFCVEMFVCGGGVLVNEVAPRPHNSGHYTIEACKTSQFENHIRAITGLPLGSPELLKPAAMRNILGSGNGAARVSGVSEALAADGVKLHVYGKREVRVGRKMGHITAVADTVEAAEAAADKAWECVEILA